MYWRKIALIVAFCANLNANSISQDTNITTNLDTNITLKPHTPKDDAVLNFNILTALELQDKEPLSAMKIYEKLYKDTGSRVYLKEALKIAYSYDEKNFLNYVNMSDEILADDSEYLRMKIGYLLNKKDYLNANTIALQLVNLEKSARHYSVLALTYYFLNDYKMSANYFEKSYELEKSEDTLLRYVDVMVNKLSDKDSAIRMLESHRLMYGCGKFLCGTLVDIYRSQQKFTQIANIDEARYNETKDTAYLEDLIGIYYYIKDYDKLIEILTKYDYRPDFLIDIYAKKGDSETAMKLARTQFQKTKNYDFLAMEAITQYESAPKPINEKIIKSVVEKFENIAPQIKDPVYLNYYGYILIDHNIDIQKGMKLVEKALEIEPDSPYYIDSLAWGFYKQGQCKRARREISKITSIEYFESDEGKEHVLAIDECVKKGKK